MTNDPIYEPTEQDLRRDYKATLKRYRDVTVGLKKAEDDAAFKMGIAEREWLDARIEYLGKTMRISDRLREPY